MECAGHHGLQGGSSTESAVVQQGPATFSHTLTCQAEGLTGVRTLDPRDHTTGQKGHLHIFWYI